MDSEPSSPRPSAVPLGLTALRAVAASVAAEWPLVGRAEELTCIWTTLNEPQAAGILLSGAAGVGKSRLVNEIANIARANDWTVVWIKATEATRDINFGVVSRWIEPSTVGAMTVSDRLAQLGGQLRTRTRSQRVLLAVDDAHLLDGGTASLVQQYGSGRNLRVVFVVRAGSAAPDAVRAVWTTPRIRRIEVQPLTLEQVEELLVTILAGRVDRPSRGALWSLCAGNVLLLRELVLAALSTGDLTSIDGVWHWQARTSVVASMRELICSRIAALTPSQRQALEAAAIGEPLPGALVAAMKFEQDMLALERVGLVRWDPEPPGAVLRLGHPLFAESVRELTPALATNRVRRSLAAAILDAPEAPADHLLRAAIWLLDSDITPDGNLLVAAARRAGTLSAYRLQERIARVGRLVYGGYDFSLLLTQALVMQARWDEVVYLCTSQPLSLADTREQRCEVAALYAEALGWGFGRLGDALGVLAHVARGYDGPGSAHCLALQGAMAMFCSDLNQAVTASEQVLAASRLPDDLLIRGLICAIPALALMGRTADAVTRAKRGQQLLTAGALVPAAWHADLVCGHINALRYGGRYTEALKLAEAFYESSDDLTPAGCAMAAFALGQARLDTGCLTQAETALREALAQFREEDLIGLLPWCLWALAQTLGLAGHAEAAADLLASAVPGRFVAPIFRPEIGRAKSWVAAATGEWSTGADLARQTATLAMRLGQPAVAARAWHDLARMGQPRPAADELAVLVNTSQSTEPVLLRDHAAALAAQDGPALDAVYERFHDAGAILHAAEAAAAAAAIHLAEGHLAIAERARQRVARCVASCDGATTLALRQAQTTDPLSRRESEIAALASRSMTNSQIADRLHLSVRTVEGHLQHIYTKLDIHCRGDLPT